MMKQHRTLDKSIAFLLGIIILVQSFGAVPVFAAGTDFFYILNYGEDDCCIEANHPIIIPDSDIDPDYGAETHSFNSNASGITVSTGSVIPDWGTEPYRVIGYTFDGWYTEPDKGGIKVERDTVITDDMIDPSFHSLTLYGGWTEYGSPDITTDSLTISAKNGKKEKLANVTLKDRDGNDGFKSDVTEYYAEVYADTQYLTLDFEQYEPDAVTSVTCNGSAVSFDDTKKQIIKQKGYTWRDVDGDSKLVGAEVNTGVKLATVEDSIELNLTSEAHEYNVIEITVRLPEASPVSEKTYKLNIKRLSMELSPNYGNTPYGRIMSNDLLDDAGRETAKAAFDASYEYRNALFSNRAWNPYGADGIEVVKGSTPTGNEYINYDKDDTAIIVYSGDSFTDPGIKLYDTSGNEVTLSDRDFVTRTINYETVPSLKSEDWGSPQQQTHTSKLTGKNSDLTVDILKNSAVKPGVYTINYSYTSGSATVTVDRNMIVLPKSGDLNMDNYVNALDALVYDKTVDENSVGSCLYKYRALDVNNDGAVDAADKTHLKNRAEIKQMYPSYSVEESMAQITYTVPSAVDDTKSQLYMDFLGTDSSNISAAADETQQLQKDDVFWVGYRFENSAKLGSGSLKSITLTVNYDSRYVKPDADTLAAYIEKINANNPQLSVFNIEGMSAVDGGYTVDKSTSKHIWQDMVGIKTLTIEMYLQDGQDFNLTDGYFIKLPFGVKTVPLSDGRSVISTQLGANSLNMALGTSSYGLMWDTSDSLNSVTENLMSKLQYMGDYVPKFVEEAEAKLLKTATYGDAVGISGNFNRQTLEGTLPQGLTYNGLNITGTAQEVGTFDFYIGGIKYRIVINKAELKVTADDKTKTYGEVNPVLTFDYDESCLKNGDTIDSAVQTEPSILCAAEEKAAYLSETPIILSGGEAENYYFTFTDGTLTVDKQREINITAITKIPVCTSKMAQNETFPFAINATAVNDASEFTAAEILTGDKVEISYNVVYNDNTVATGKTVDITDTKIITEKTGYESGANYTVKSCIQKSTGGVVEAKSVTGVIIMEPCTLSYTYGTPLNLNTGRIRIFYDNGEVLNKTFEEAKSYGIRIRYGRTNTEAKNGDKISVKNNNGDVLIVDYPSNSSIPELRTGQLIISKKDLHITADNKERYYGDNNTAVTFTYTFTDSDFVYGDTKTTFTGFIEPTFSCDADASTEIDKTNGYSEADIVLTGGSSDNYNIVCANGTLKINKRPLDITAITAGVPALTARDYAGKTAPYHLDTSAVAGTVGEGETASMEVGNLYNNDSVRITYKAQYASSTPADSVDITVVGAALDDTYGKSYNYTLRNVVPTAPGGRVYVKSITALELITEPTLSYVYGTPLALNTGKIKITYDSGDVNEVTFNEAKSHPVKLTYTGTVSEPVNEEHLTVDDSGKTITVTPDTIYEVDPITSGVITVTPHELHVAADSIYTTYGDEIPPYTYTYTAGDFQYGENEDSAVTTKPSIVCKEDNGLTDLNQKTLSGVYTMKISGGEADNYSFVYTNGSCTIRQRPLVITAIGNIPVLSSKNAFENKLSFDVSVETDKDSSTLTFGAEQGPLWQDKVRIDYTVTYPDASAVGETDVNIENAVLDKTYGDARNYYLQKIVSPVKGSVNKALIEDISIISDPTKNTDGTAREYSYGDRLNLSGGRFRIVFDSGRVDENVTFDKLSDYGITATYTGTSDNVADDVFLTIDYHNNKTITLTPPSDATAQIVKTGAIKVNKRKMHVIANDAQSVYGDMPSYTLSYTEADLAEGETLLTAFGSVFEMPVLYCDVYGTEAGVLTSAGTYPDSIKIRGGSCNNYEFVCEDFGTLTVKKRELTIKSIDKSVPMLTAVLINQSGKRPPIEIPATAVNEDLTLENLANDDSIGITYTVVYNSIETTPKITVDVKNIAFDTALYPKCSNYDLKSVPTTSDYGSIQEPSISSIRVVKDPDKMEYNYGESFKLSGGSVDVVYNENYVVNTSFDKLSDYDIKLTFEKNGERVRNNSIITVANHNGYRLVLTADGVESAYSGPMTVHKHTMKIIAEDKSFTYGENVPGYTFRYNSGDLVNGDTFNGDNFKSNLTAPVLSCKDGEEEIASVSNVGNYVITAQGASSDNYNFEYVNGVMTVKRRPLNIESINSGVPVLTSAIIRAESGNVHRLTGTAANDKNEITVSNLVGEDIVAITYKAVYTSVEPSENVQVGIESAAMEDSYGKSANYSVAAAPATAEGGAIKDKEIVSMEILAQPVIEYIYGDRLNLASGRVRVKYDSGQIDEVNFSQLPAGKTTVSYTNKSAAANGDVLNVNYHNNVTITVTAISPHEVDSIVTDPITVHKKKLNIDADDITSTYGESIILYWSYRASDFVNGESLSSSDFTSGLVSPSISCRDDDGNDVGALTDAGVYDIVVSGGRADNYEFVYNDGTLVIEKRPLNIVSIDRNVPILTSRIIFENPSEVHRLRGSAVNTQNQMTVTNIVNNDSVRITYTAVYTSVEAADTVNVGIENALLDDSYGKSANYRLNQVTATSPNGRIMSEEISGIEITEQPVLEYTYGDRLDLSGGRLKITYDSGDIAENVSFDELNRYGVHMTYGGTEDIAASGDKLIVPYHNGKIITLTPETKNDVSPVSTEAITVSKKKMDVSADKASVIYGEEPVLSFTYDEEDFVNGETAESPDFISGLTAPVVRAADGEGSVGPLSSVGDYTVTVSGGSADNYEFVYHDGVLTVEKRPIRITSIDSGVPHLTSDIIYREPGEIHRLDSTAVNSQMTAENIVNNDLVRVKYTVVYTSIEPAEEVSVGIENAAMDDPYERSANYYIEAVTDSAPHGRIYDKAVKAVEITEQPDLEYIYGDRLDLSGGKVKTIYDSGLVVETAFNELPPELTLTYTDSEDKVADGDILTVPYHNNKTMTITASSVHDVAADVTDKITVAKRILEYGECSVDSIVYDGKTTVTTGTVVFANPQNGDKVTAKGTFNFDNCNAGEEKTVYVTDITLDSEFTANYQLPSDSVTAVGKIEKALEVPQLSAENVAVSDITNAVTVTAPAMTETQIDGGAEYEYSADGGKTWQKSNVFDNLKFGQDCEICIRFAETDNYKQSESTLPVKVKAYLNRITLISYTDGKLLKSFFTNTESVQTEAEFRELIGDVGEIYYDCYKDEEGKEKITFPFVLDGDTRIYTSLKKTNIGGGGAVSWSTPKPKASPSPTPSPSSNPTVKPTASPKPVATDKPHEPYMSGYDGMIWPDNNMTRAEAAVVMVKVSGDTGLEYKNIFPDVDADLWYGRFISQGNARGLISGFNDGYFHPEDIVTREQFASMVARMIKLEPIEGTSFNDVTQDRWSAGYIKAVADSGIASGYEDGTFRPENPITRAEAARMINVAIGLVPDKEMIDKIQCPFADLPKKHWAYYEMMAASCELQ